MKAAMTGLFVIAMIGLLVAVGSMVLSDIENQRETTILRLEAEAAEARANELNAQANADEAAAELERAQGEAYLKARQGDAIYEPAAAAADAVRVQSGIVEDMGKTNALYDRALLMGTPFIVGLILMAGGTLMGFMVLGVMLYQQWKKNQALMEQLQTQFIHQEDIVDLGA